MMTASGRERWSAGLRMMTAADLDQIMGLEESLFGPDTWTREMLAAELEQQPATRHYVVAEDADRLVGYAGLLAAGEQGDVLTIGVDAGRQGRGIGTSLLRALLAEAARRGCKEVFLEVRTDNYRAQELYRRHDFTEVGIRRGYYQPSGADAIVMRLAVDPGDFGGPDVPGEAGDPVRPGVPAAPGHRSGWWHR